MKQPFRVIESVPVVMPQANLDTDQIIPARFLKVTSRLGLGKSLFADWRYHKDGTADPTFVLNTEAAQQSQILVAGDNFGCGSSREHAPWSLVDYGFRVVISTRFADIFRNNALKNGLLPVVVSQAFYTELLAHPNERVRVDLTALQLTLHDGSHTAFEIDAFARYLLLNGLDELDFLLQQDAAIGAFEAQAS